jgi:GNAT superfamily N-acetyltransferase
LDSLVRELGYSVRAGEVWTRIEEMPGGLYRTLVAVKEENVVGFGGVLILPVYEHESPIGWILALCVLPAYRKQGIGTRLLEALENCCREEGVVDIRLHSGMQRPEAHKFYQGLGYDISGYRFIKKCGP